MEKHDLIVIGMGPAGMAVTAMAANMGLDVLAVEKHKVGGECLNYGCIPSKALLKAGEVNEVTENLKQFGIKMAGKTEITNPLEIVRKKVENISGAKTMKAFARAKLIVDQGEAKFIDKKVIEVANQKYTADKIFIATGTEPFIPPIPGLKDVSRLTNLNIFEQNDIPETLTIIGGGAIGSEMAQAFSRLGSKVNIFQIDSYLIPSGDEEAGRVLEDKFKKEGIGVYNSTKINKVEEKNNKIIIDTDQGIFESDKILVATGRKAVLNPLKLDNAGIKYDKTGIKINKKLETNIKGIYAVGDCNGKALLSHAAMHQGMLALMNAINPTPLKQLKYDDYLVPWSVFTKPEIAQAGITEKEAKEKGLSYQIVKEEYENYGRTIADGKPEGFVKVITNNKGKIFGATIVGEQASELIHEWILAIQHNISMFDIMMTQHSFPTISLMNKRVAESWMMKKTESGIIPKIAKKLI